VDGFLEEIIVRRELADNFCYVSSCGEQLLIYLVLSGGASACSMYG